MLPTQAAAPASVASSVASVASDDDEDYGPIPDPTDDLPTTKPSSGSAEPEVTRRIGGGLRVSSQHVMGAPARAPRVSVNYTEQQNAIIHSPAKIIVAKAFAGAGKTTTAIGYADARPNERMLYVAFNKGIQEEAAARFGSNVTCRTTHSLAYAEVGKHYAKRISRPWRALVLKNETGITSIKDAAITQSILNGFFHSDSDDIQAYHGNEAADQFGAADHEIHACVALARGVWRRMLDRSDSVSIPDDAYLKMWALSKPKLRYDRIIFDEAQDANPVTAQIIRGQTHAGLLYIGDPHQSIYGFRGATNAMNDFAETAKHLNLSQTWRFGPRIAYVANCILGELKGEKVLIEGMGTDSNYVKGAPITKLARTNAQLFKDAAQRMGEGIHWVGGSKNYQLGRLLEAFNLYSGKRDQITDPFLRHFGSWAEMQNYAEEAKDPETRVLAEVVDEFRNETPHLVHMIKQNEVLDAKQAETILTTAHKAKGLDWDFVQLAEDFEVLAETEAELAIDPNAPVPEQELNLLYVAATRAKKRLQLNEESLNWIKALPEHRAARQLAVDKRDRRQADRQAAVA